MLGYYNFTKKNHIHHIRTIIHSQHSVMDRLYVDTIHMQQRIMAGNTHIQSVIGKIEHMQPKTYYYPPQEQNVSSGLRVSSSMFFQFIYLDITLRNVFPASVKPERA